MVADMSEKLKPTAPASEEEKQLARLTIAVPQESERGFLTTSELQKIIPLSRRSIFEWRRKGILPSIQIGSKILYHRESVIAALLRRQNGGAVQ
jgi:hypothetical protein